jgi:hypothetical protein
LWERSSVQSVLVNEDGSSGANATAASESIGSVIISGLALSRVNETETLDLNLSGTVNSQKLGAGIKNEWIKVTISLVVTGVGLAIDCDLNVEDIWLGVLWNLASNEGVACKRGFDENIFFLSITESAHEIRAVVVIACEASSSNLDNLVL